MYEFTFDIDISKSPDPQDGDMRTLDADTIHEFLAENIELLTEWWLERAIAAQEAA